MRARTILVALILAVPGMLSNALPVAAATSGHFYVDGKHGSDANSGTSLANAFKTIAKAASSLPAGSSAAGWTISVFGYTDYLYRERPVPPGWDRAGTAARPVVFEAYGYNGTSSGFVRPIVSGADVAPSAGQSWTSVGDGVWQTSWSGEPLYFNELSGSLRTAVFQDTTSWLWQRSDLSDLHAHAWDGSGGYWWSSSSKLLYVAPLNHASPTGHTFDVVMRKAFYFYGPNGVHDVTVQGFDVRHSGNGISFAEGVDDGIARDNRLIGNLLMGIAVSGRQTGSGPDPSNNTIIERNEGAYNTLQAVKLDEGTVNATVCDNNFHHNGLQGIKVQGPPGGTGYTGVSSGNTICRNQLHDQFFNPTGSDWNNASGVTIANGARSTTVDGNLIWGNDVGIHVTQESTGMPAMTGTVVENNAVWSNRRFALYLFDGLKGSGSGDLTASHELYWGNGIGVMADRGTSNKTLDHVTVWNNTNEGIKIGAANTPATSLVVRDSIVTSNGGYGIWLVTGSNASVSYSALWGNREGQIKGTPQQTVVNNRPPSYLSTSVGAPGFLTIGTLSYQFTAGPSATPIGALWATGFVDIASSTFEPDIIWLANAGITGGCAPNYFCPDDPVTRGQMAAFLDRGLSLPSTSTDYFTDDNSSIYQTDINRLAASGITKGCSATTFCPAANVTRGQMAAFLVRALSLPAASTDYFSDDNGTTFEHDINALAAAGITKGCTATTFCPNADVTRGQMAAFLHRALG